MRISILGGTGDIGEGLALRWAAGSDHSIIIGSRKPEKAERKVEEYNSLLVDRGVDADLVGYGNDEAAALGDVVIVGVPPEYAVSTVESIIGGVEDGAILVSPVVSMIRDEDGFHYDRPDEGSMAEAIATVTPDDIPVVGAYQNLGANALSNLDNELAVDTIVTGDDESAKDVVSKLTAEIDGLRPLDGGALGNSAEVEAITPLLINVAIHNAGLHDLGVKFQ